MDRFSDYPTSLTSPARDGLAIAPSDTVNIAEMPRAVYVGQTGDVAALMAGGQSVVFRNVPAGSILPVRVTRINQTGTTATDLVVLW